MSLLDGLTGIPNRRRFDEVLAHEWKQAMLISGADQALYEAKAGGRNRIAVKRKRLSHS